ncbi:hypothetical protein [Colwellia psychrerythraea]|jgi:hypothetical protein|uniref:Uncharacterized protein n=1 Tax=Colwellia psychrerythraea (strain 34H / ATCC BAA-681) TaxID=167879 RepID=Q47X68_COLP3|nr:hypothetical protein [Colwellia psychrerythraea]AAZ27769.1 hypothetical protein CPS_3944 [Colwellia psychrerythraea 34H]
MNDSLVKSFKTMYLTSVFLFCNLAGAEHFTVDRAENYPYKNLINRTDSLKVFYIMNGESFSCKVEAVLDNMMWVSPEKKISKELFYNDPLSNCLSREKAKQILSQTVLEFGQGL